MDYRHLVEGLPFPLKQKLQETAIKFILYLFKSVKWRIYGHHLETLPLIETRLELFSNKIR